MLSDCRLDTYSAEDSVEGWLTGWMASWRAGKRERVRDEEDTPRHAQRRLKHIIGPNMKVASLDTDEQAGWPAG